MASAPSKATPGSTAPTKRPTPTPANDIHPSIPVNPPAVRPAPTPKPASKSP
jgi:hypothetical protein